MAIPGYFARNSCSSGATTFPTRADCRADPQRSAGRTAALVAHAVERLHNQFHAGMAMPVGQLAFVRQRRAARRAQQQARVQPVFSFWTSRLTAEPATPNRSLALAKLPSLTTAMNAITPA